MIYLIRKKYRKSSKGSMTLSLNFKSVATIHQFIIYRLYVLFFELTTSKRRTGKRECQSISFRRVEASGPRTGCLKILHNIYYFKLKSLEKQQEQRSPWLSSVPQKRQPYHKSYKIQSQKGGHKQTLQGLTQAQTWVSFYDLSIIFDYSVCMY